MSISPHTVHFIRSAGHLVFGSPYSANLLVERGPGKPGDWDGRLTLGWFSRPGCWQERSFEAATRPGLKFLRSPMNPQGTAMLALGQHRLSHARGKHNGREALVQVAKALPVLRDPDRDDVHEPVVVSTGTGLNIHDVATPHDLAGCIGLRTADMHELVEMYDWLDKKAVERGAVTLNERVTLTLVGVPK